MKDYVSRLREWDGFTLRHSDFRVAAGAHGEVGLNQQIRLTFFLEAIGVRPARADSRIVSAGPPRANTISLLPRGFENWLCTDRAGEVRLATIAFDNAALESKLQERVADSVLADPKLNFTSAPLMALARKLVLAVEVSDRYAALQSDRLLTLLLIELMRHGHTEERLSGCSLTPTQRARVFEFLASNLGQTVRLAELAALTGLSVSHFCHAFKKSTGVSAHHWQLNQRIRTAQHLLASGSEPIVHIAAALGFSDQSHFTRVFRRTVGCTPAAWRREQSASRLVSKLLG